MYFDEPVLLAVPSHIWKRHVPPTLPPSAARIFGAPHRTDSVEIARYSAARHRARAAPRPSGTAPAATPTVRYRRPGPPPPPSSQTRFGIYRGCCVRSHRPFLRNSLAPTYATRPPFACMHAPWRTMFIKIHIHTCTYIPACCVRYHSDGLIAVDWHDLLYTES